MSFKAHVRNALDPDRTLPHRMSAARSCAVLVSQKWGVPRSVVLDDVRMVCGVDLTVPAMDDDLAKAVAVLSDFRERGLPTRDIPDTERSA